MLCREYHQVNAPAPAPGFQLSTIDLL